MFVILAFTAELGLLNSPSEFVAESSLLLHVKKIFSHLSVEIQIAWKMLENLIIEATGTKLTSQILQAAPLLRSQCVPLRDSTKDPRQTGKAA